MKKIKLSILIPVHKIHESLFFTLYENLTNQIQKENATDIVEILYHIDNGEISTGSKRNGLLEQSKGEYVIFPDSDDEVPDYYISELLKACESGADCFGMNGKMTTDGHSEIGWELSMHNPNLTVTKNGKPFYLRSTNHISGAKRELALQAKFPDLKLAEDKGYSQKLIPLLKTEFKIIPPMYHYKFTTKNKLY